MSSDTPKSGPDVPIIIRILALHGKEGDGPSFKETIQGPLRSSFSNLPYDLQVDTITAPFCLQEGTESYAWWTLPPGVRSFSAQEYDGFDTSADLVLNAIKDGEYDIVLGHSQGAILLAALLADSTEELLQSNDAASQKKKKRIGFVLNGVAWPNPFTSQLENLALEEEKASLIRPDVLFVIGENDRINPPEGARRVCESLKKAGAHVTTLLHPDGHSVPVHNEKCIRDIAEWIIRTVEEGKSHDV